MKCHFLFLLTPFPIFLDSMKLASLSFPFFSESPFLTPDRDFFLSRSSPIAPDIPASSFFLDAKGYLLARRFLPQRSDAPLQPHLRAMFFLSIRPFPPFPARR